MRLAWLRRDLRTDDQPVLDRAVRGGQGAVLLVDDPVIRSAAAPLRVGFYDESVEALVEALEEEGVDVRRLRGDPVEIVVQAADGLGADEVAWTVERGPGRRRDARVAAALEDRGIRHAALGGDLAVDPATIDRGGTFAAYFSRWLKARAALGDAEGYEELPSPLSPHLRFGRVSPGRIAASFGPDEGWGEETEGFARSLAWRDYAYWLLDRHPDMVTRALEPWAVYLEWRDDPEALDRWREGLTGFPIVDASMRCLREEGFIPNGHRMAVGSFLTKHLGIHWREGARWFMRTLIDGDPVVNAMNWQWVASVGVERAGYIRILNPWSQRDRLDPDGSFVERWVPEAGTVDYPDPIVDHREARAEALARYRRAKERWRS